MSRIILIGGGRLIDEKFEWIDYYINSEKKILVIPSFSKNDQKWFEIIKKRFNYFDEERFVLFDFNKNTKFEDFDLIIGTGGYPDILMKKITYFKKRIQKWFLKKSNIYLGISSGALILSNKTIITKDEDYEKSFTFNGLGILPYSIEVHYSPEIDTELKAFDLDKVVAISEDSGIVIENNKLVNFFGENYVFRNSKKDKIGLNIALVNGILDPSRVGGAPISVINLGKNLVQNSNKIIMISGDDLLIKNLEHRKTSKLVHISFSLMEKVTFSEIKKSFKQFFF